MTLYTAAPCSTFTHIAALINIFSLIIDQITMQHEMWKVLLVVIEIAECEVSLRLSLSVVLPSFITYGRAKTPTQVVIFDTWWAAGSCCQRGGVFPTCRASSVSAQTTNSYVCHRGDARQTPRVPFPREPCVFLFKSCECGGLEVCVQLCVCVYGGQMV